MSLSSTQLATLTAVCDTFVPSIARADDPDGFWARKASDTGTPQLIAYVTELAPPEAQARFAALLDLLGSAMLGSTWGGPAKGFVELTAEERERVLLAWQHSPSADLRAAYTGLAGAILPMYYGWSDERGPNPNWKAIGYDGPISPPPAIERPIRPFVADSDTVLDCDTVVIGSGAGGGVVAGELADAGHDVIVIEKGPYVAEDGFDQRELLMMKRLYERGGGLQSKNAAVQFLAGSCLGGGTTVNWSGALRAPDYVLEEWANDHGNPHFLSPAFRRSIEAVERATNVNLDETHVDAKGACLQRGAAALGYVVNKYPRNVKGCDPAYCGYCNFGCQKGAKQSMVKTYLQRAFDRGARILADTEVARVVIETGRARGVEAIQHGSDGAARRVTIRAKRVVVSAGSIHTPALLRRSGLTHPEIGRNLYIHPATGVSACYPESIRAWSGSMMPLSCDQFARLDGNFGFKLVNAPLHPVWLSTIAFHSGADHKQRMLESARLVSFGPFVRDRDTGVIELDAAGQPVIDYWPSAYDMAHLVRGIQEAARLHFAAGAELIHLPQGRRFQTTHGKQKLEELLAELPSLPWEPNRLVVLSAHQMGTCRMGGNAKTHPVTPEGRAVEVENLYVADASTFPTCSGANPSPSVQHIAHYIAQGIRAAT